MSWCWMSCLVETNNFFKDKLFMDGNDEKFKWVIDELFIIDNQNSKSATVDKKMKKIIFEICKTKNKELLKICMKKSREIVTTCGQNNFT